MSRNPHTPPAPASAPPARPAPGPDRPPHDVRRREQRGSVLIFVVGVLLLLAIVATAFLGTSRSDRTATQQNAFNTQIDLLLEGVVNAGKSRILGDESVAGRMTATTPIEDFDAPIVNGTITNDDWLASRVPVTADLNQRFVETSSATAQNTTTAAKSIVTDLSNGNGAENPAIWPAISESVLGEKKFESPYRPAGYVGSLEFNGRTRLLPTFLTFGGKNWPAFELDTAPTPDTSLPGNTVAATRYQPFLAADADGDGVADSGLFRIPIGQLSGITYFGAVRIIDNNAAVNLNTAQSRDIDFDGVGTGYPISNSNPGNVAGLAGAFTSGVGLAELLRSYNPAPPSAGAYDNMYNSTAAFDEFSNLNVYRLNLGYVPPITPIRPGGVVLNTTDPTIFDDTITSASTPVGKRVYPAASNSPEFQFASIGQMLDSQLSRRTANPGNSFPVTGALAKSLYVDSLSLASRFCLVGPTEFNAATPANSENALARKLYLTLDYMPTGTANTYPGQLARTTPFNPTDPGGGIDAWFAENFNYLNENLTDASTFMNRRTILTGINGVTGEVSNSIAPPDYLYLYTASQWTGTGSPLVTRLTAVYNPFRPIGGTVDVPSVPMTIASASAVATAIAVDPKISINTGRFEELFYGYFKTMAREGFTGLADDKGTPFSTLFNGNVDVYNGTTSPIMNTAAGYRSSAAFNFSAANGFYALGSAQDPPTQRNNYYRDPYIGSRFIPGTAAGGPYAARTDAAQPSVVNGQTGTAEQNPLRMFRSPLRPPAGTRTTVSPTAAVWDVSTPRLPADQVLILRAAIAAANLETLRDSSKNQAIVDGGENDRVIEHRIPLTARMGAGGLPVAVVARVFGLKRQPYITEVYANTSNGDDNIVAINAAPPANVSAKGYVAIKLYNPYPVAISLQYCRLVGLRRVIDPTVTTTPATTQYPNMELLPMPTAATFPPVNTVDQIDLGTATSNLSGGTLPGYVIPANGTLVLENYDGTGNPGGSTPAAPHADDATHRPSSSGLRPNIGPIPLLPALGGFGPTQNIAYVPGLQRVVWDREMVLMRPTNCQPPSATGAPINTLVYTFPDGVTQPLSIDMVPLDSYDFTGLNVPDGSAPTRVRAEAWHYVRSIDASRPWRWVYPGRYDGDQSLITAAAPTPLPRQQGTLQAYSQTDGAVGWDPGAGEDKDPWAEVPPTTVPPFAVTLNQPASVVTTANYPDTFTMQLNVTDWPSNNKLHSPTTPNMWPFGGFRRLADMLEAPFVGSYTIQTEANAAAGAEKFLEVNPVTMDSAMAEDTDPNDNEYASAVIDNGTQSREQLGRFLPLRPSIGSAIGGRVNGSPAFFTFEPSPPATRPPMLSVNYDLAFDTTNGTAVTLDPLRYRDDVADNDIAPLPVTGVPLNDLKNVRTNRYQWANALFDHFTVQAPHDDYTPDYPTQPRWQKNTAYSVGDTIQYGQHVYVCVTAHTSSNTDSPVNTVIDPGSTARTGALITMPTNPAGSPWLVLPRTPVSNGGALAGDRSNILNTTLPVPRPFDYLGTDDGYEVTAPRAGLINLNTAPEKVLAMLPWSPRTAADNLKFDFSMYPFNPGAGGVTGITGVSDTIDDNAQIAHLIVMYRDGNYYNRTGTVSSTANNIGIGSPAPLAGGSGIRQFVTRADSPFTSLYDLYKVPGFLAAQNALLAARNPGLADGDYSPFTAAGDSVRYDFEEQSLFLNRIANLVTTRSDVFTLYALVQGWRNVGTANPELVVQRRAAYIIDRSGVTAASPTLSSTRVPVN